MERVEASEVEIGAVHDVEGARLRQKQVEDVHVPQFRVGNMDERRDAAAQVEQRVELDARLRGAEQGPRKNGQAQVDGGRVKGEHRVVEFQAEVVVGVQRSRDADQFLRELRVYAPVPPPVGVGQGVARDLAPDAHVVELARMRAQADLDVAQTLPVGQLGDAMHRNWLVHGKDLT